MEQDSSLSCSPEPLQVPATGYKKLDYILPSCSFMFRLNIIPSSTSKFS
jgi:hypothetical protein